MRDHLVEHPAINEETPALIEHILARYHETHRRELRVTSVKMVEIPG